MAYEKTNWTSTTPINTTNLNNMEDGIEQNSIDIESTNEKFNYSTEEQVIGTWISGKPIYRKIVTTTVVSSSTSNETTILENSDIETIINMYGIVAYNNGVHQIGAYANANFYSLLQYSSQWYKVYFYGADNYVGYPATITIEYTKTTD